MTRAHKFVASFVLLSLLSLIACDNVAAQYSGYGRRVVVPGTGQRVAYDNFEDAKWKYIHNFPKASRDNDKRVREPLGYSSNGLWYESAKRGQPDYLVRVAPPKGGIPGSKGALMIRTRDSGAPGRLTVDAQQDDLLFNNQHGAVSVAKSPNVVVRVYMPPFSQWEKNTGSTFGFRAGLTATVYEYKRKGLIFRRKRKSAKTELFYPGMFVMFNSKANGAKEDSAMFIIRRNSQGNDFYGPKITKPGWWTLGMSFTADGRAHYFAREGIDKLTMKDLIASSSYGGTRLETFQTMFFDVLSKNNGKSWSTPWVIDDPSIHIGARRAVAAGTSGR